MSSPLQLDLEFCRQRQQRLCQHLAEESIDLALIVSHENIQYLTGFRPHRLMQAIVALTPEGVCRLSAPNSVPDHHAADEVVTFEAQWLATLRQEQLDAALASLISILPQGATRRLGLELPTGLIAELGTIDFSRTEIVNLDPHFWRQRRAKDPDELNMIARAIDCTEAMYRRGREIIEPGITELEVFNQLQAAAVEVAGEPLTATGNDYQCGTPGGPPRDRIIEAGELYILDLGPCYRGYYADNCRTIAVDGSPTDEQFAAWEQIVKVLEMVESTVKPGVSCKSLYEDARSMLDNFLAGGFFHHLGHGFGLFPHEAPHLNPNWDDDFAEGDCFTAEPGLYADSLKGGIRLEQNYRVTTDGVERLTHMPLEL